MGHHTRVTSVGGLSHSHADGRVEEGWLTAWGDSPASTQHCNWGTERDVSNHYSGKRSHFYIC